MTGITVLSLPPWAGCVTHQLARRCCLLPKGTGDTVLPRTIRTATIAAWIALQPPAVVLAPVVAAVMPVVAVSSGELTQLLPTTAVN